MEPSGNIDQTTAVVGEMPPAAIQELLDLAQAAPIEILIPPASGLSMMPVLDAFDSEFFLGEVLVSRCEVLLEGRRGFGMVTGDEPQRALARACAEVLLQGTDQLLKARVQKLLQREQSILEDRRRREARLIAGTKVHFELMTGI